MDVPLGHYFLVHMTRLIIGPNNFQIEKKNNDENFQLCSKAKGYAIPNSSPTTMLQTESFNRKCF